MDRLCSVGGGLRAHRCNSYLQTLLLSPKFHCTEEILTIVSLLSVDSVLYDPPSRRDEVQAVRRKFVSSEGDHITLLNIYRAFKNLGRSKVGLSRGLLSRDALLPSQWNVRSPRSVCTGLTGETRSAGLRPARVLLILTGQGPCTRGGLASLLQMSSLLPPLACLHGSIHLEGIVVPQT